jgi:AraC-like DNA-binding protein
MTVLENKKDTPSFALSVSAAITRVLCDFLVDKGFKAKDLEALIGAPLELLPQDDCRIELDRYHALWDEAIRFSGQPDLALQLGSNSALDGMGLVGHIFFNCKTLESAIQHYQRYYSVINEGIDVTLDREGELAVLTYHVQEAIPYCRSEMEYTVALAAARAKNFLKTGLDVSYVMFQHEKPAYAERYEHYFSCPVRFSQSGTGLAFKASYLDFEIPRHSPSLYRVLSSHLEGLLGVLRRRGRVSMQVARIVRQKLSKEDLDADYVAYRLNMSRNTLYRHLKKEGLSYHDIVDRVRADYARECLKSGDYTVTEVAFLLGFSELSAFSRAYKRWTGQSPKSVTKGK